MAYHPHNDDGENLQPNPAGGLPAGSITPLKGPRMNIRQLTGYPQQFVDQLNGVITQCITQHRAGALLVLSIENLPMIMNAYGIDASEHVIRHVEQSIREVVGDTDITYRIQRDQFGIIIHDRKDDELSYLVKRLNSHIQQWCADNDYGSIHVVSVIATVQLPDQAKHAEEALSKGYMALHDRSLSTSTMRQFEERKEEAAFSRQEMALANYLNQAIAEDRLVMAYQPIVSSKDGTINHYEALLRIRSDDGKISSAGALIPIAERMGLIDIIDEKTLMMTLEQLRTYPDVSLAFNISNLTTQNEKWLDVFSREICKTPEIAPRLTVEITETAAQLDLHQTAYFVAEIQALGCLVALDDFGSGYTSFRQLKTLSVDMVKIDGSFVKDLIDNSDNRFFVKTLLDFTNGFGLKSVAEYVENGEIAKMLMELGVEMLQGYYFGRPEVGEPWLTKRKGAPDS